MDLHRGGTNDCLGSIGRLLFYIYYPASNLYLFLLLLLCLLSGVGVGLGAFICNALTELSLSTSIDIGPVCI